MPRAIGYRTRALLAAGIAAVTLTACPIPFQGPIPMPAPWIDKPSDLTIHFGSCASSLPDGNRCIWFRHVRPGQTPYYVRGPYVPAAGYCNFYPQFGDVYIGDEWDDTNYLRVFNAPDAC